MLIMKYDINDTNKYHWRINYKRHGATKRGYTMVGIITPKDAVSYLNKMRDTYQYSHLALMAYDKEYDCYFMIADYVKLPDLRDWAELMSEQKYEAAKDDFLHNSKEYEGMSVEDVENVNPHIF